VSPREVVGDLSAIRKELDRIDRKLVDLLVERSSVIEEVVRYKGRYGLPVVDRAREAEVLEAAAAYAGTTPLDPRIATDVLRAVIDGFTRLQLERLSPEDA